MYHKHLIFIPIFLLFLGFNSLNAQNDCGTYSLKNLTSGATNSVELHYENPIDANGNTVPISFVDIEFKVDFSNPFTVIDIPASNASIVTPPLRIDAVGTSSDVIEIDNNILQTELLDEPWQRVAANAHINGVNGEMGDANQSITAFDMVKIRKSILSVGNGIEQDWVVLNTDNLTGLNNPTNPPSVPTFSEEYVLSVQNDIQLHDLFGIKIGDVNGTCEDPMGENIENITTERTINMPTRGGTVGQTIQIPVFVNGFINQAAFSMGLHFLDDILEVTDILDGSLMVSSPQDTIFKIHDDKRGFDMVWFDTTSTGASSGFSPLFYIEGTVLEAFSTLNNKAELDDSKVLNVIFPIENQGRTIDKFTLNRTFNRNQLDDKISYISTAQNKVVPMPNPFTTTLTWELNIPQAEEAIIKITDISGKTCLMRQQYLNKGYNRINFSNLSNLPIGYLNYQIILSNEVISGKILKIE